MSALGSSVLTTLSDDDTDSVLSEHDITRGRYRARSEIVPPYRAAMEDVWERMGPEDATKTSCRVDALRPGKEAAYRRIAHDTNFPPSG
jgi:uncharacterized protein (DUF2236 family)